MNLRREDLTRTVRAPAKLNLYLEVLGRRDDGFHELETLMVPVRIWDSLSITPTPPSPSDGAMATLEFAVRSAMPLGQSPLQAMPLPTDRENLVVRALELLRERCSCRAGGRVELVKRIPVSAGLGGGSSDAAAALRLANHVWQIGWSRTQLAELAAELGSDVPFFLYDRAAICRGRGERVEPLPAVPRLHFVIVKPPQGISTSDVYRTHATHSEASEPANRSALPSLSSLINGKKWGNVQRWMTNRLQSAAALLSPWVNQAREVFSRLDCQGHQLSGSGSAYFGICRHAQHAHRLAAILRSQKLGFVYTTSSC
jgi:4-diphosphocytidyl-2-C-methyl-D-erythritol kinase